MIFDLAAASKNTALEKYEKTLADQKTAAAVHIDKGGYSNSCRLEI